MNKDEIFEILKKLDFPKDEFYILSGASLVIRGLREKCSDIDLCISNELFEKIKDKFKLTEGKKNPCGFYHISDTLEIVVNKKKEFNMEIFEPYNLESLQTILEFKEKRNKPKDQVDIEKIKEYLINRKNTL